MMIASSPYGVFLLSACELWVAQSRCKFSFYVVQSNVRVLLVLKSLPHRVGHTEASIVMQPRSSGDEKNSVLKQ